MCFANNLLNEWWLSLFNGSGVFYLRLDVDYLTTPTEFQVTYGTLTIQWEGKTFQDNKG